LELLPGWRWEAELGELAFHKESDRPRTRRHRVWVPHTSAARTPE
jgi:hypothetical protein